ncbi:hypothetical protein DY251_16310 [Mesorhizobium denitrificans]|uniref:Uncharacterized protein n=1 Tax=Mesorhizobium denitrificans TaxID=2294114 RepID=A0A371X9E5_9HYPH|nr:hypothetical protein DY251_16310 [Mesorhizobium denitrificans]
MTTDRFLDICDAPNVQAAALKGDQLGWQRLTKAETEEWRSNFLNYNGGSVDVVGWPRERKARSDSMSFWVAVGPNAHKACAYSTARPGGWLDALSARLGEPDTLDKDDTVEVISASWTRGTVEYSFAQAGSSASITIAAKR